MLVELEAFCPLALLNRLVLPSPFLLLDEEVTVIVSAEAAANATALLTMPSEISPPAFCRNAESLSSTELIEAFFAGFNAFFAPPAPVVDVDAEDEDDVGTDDDVDVD